MIFPRTFRVRQTFERTRVADVAVETTQELARLNLRDRIQPGQSVAIIDLPKHPPRMISVHKIIVVFCV